MPAEAHEWPTASGRPPEKSAIPPGGAPPRDASLPLVHDTPHSGRHTTVHPVDQARTLTGTLPATTTPTNVSTPTAHLTTHTTRAGFREAVFPHGVTRTRPRVIAAAASRTAAHPHALAHTGATTHSASHVATTTRATSAGEDAPPRNPNAVTLHPASWPLLRIVCWQLILVLGLLAIGRSVPLAVGLAVGSVVLLVLSTLRVRGSWASTVLGRRLRLMARPKRANLHDAEDPSEALLALLVPQGRVYEDELAGRAAGVLSRPEELVTILRPEDTAADALARYALLGALLPESDPDGPETGLQIVLHRRPQQLGEHDAGNRAWLTVRALRDSETVHDEALRIVLSNTVRRVRRRLRRAGLEVSQMSGAEMKTTLTALTHTGSDRRIVQEEWHCWRAGHVIQKGILLTDTTPRPAAERAALLNRLLAAAPGVACTLSATDTAREPMVLRLAATTEATAKTSADQLVHLAGGLGIRAEHLDGLHARAVAASLPMGGNHT